MLAPLIQKAQQQLEILTMKQFIMFSKWIMQIQQLLPKKQVGGESMMFNVLSTMYLSKFHMSKFFHVAMNHIHYFKKNNLLNNNFLINCHNNFL